MEVFLAVSGNKRISLTSPSVISTGAPPLIKDTPSEIRQELFLKSYDRRQLIKTAK